MVELFYSHTRYFRKHPPREIVTGREVYFIIHCRTVSGSYVESSGDATVINNTTPQTYACITLVPAGILQVSQTVFCIYSGRTFKQITIT